jgi:lipoprotein-anchoring transpeptidase ErfK/SrfK
MQRCSLTICLVLASLAGTDASFARSPSADDVNAAEFGGKQKSPQAVNLKAQVLLARAGFSPGAIDGRNGENFQNALSAFQKRNALNESGKLDKETWAKLVQNSEPVLIEYTISAADLKGPFADEIPLKYEERAKLKRLDYTSAPEMLAERFHMDQEFFEELNRGKKLDQAGTALLVANVNVKPAAIGAKAGKLEKAAKVEVDKQNSIVRVLAKDGSLLATYPASIGSEAKPAPSGTLKVVRVARNPTYTYDPEFKFRGVKAEEKLHMAPGPNNPVGSVWIALDQKSYGIHGSAEPSKVGKIGSHGCVRMTNWDALALAKIVRKGMPVQFID